VVDVSYVAPTPGVNGPNWAAGPSVSDSVAGTVPPTGVSAVAATTSVTALCLYDTVKVRPPAYRKLPSGRPAARDDGETAAVAERHVAGLEDIAGRDRDIRDPRRLSGRETGRQHAAGDVDVAADGALAGERAAGDGDRTRVRAVDRQLAGADRARAGPRVLAGQEQRAGAALGQAPRIHTRVARGLTAGPDREVGLVDVGRVGRQPVGPAPVDLGLSPYCRFRRILARRACDRRHEDGPLAPLRDRPRHPAIRRRPCRPYGATAAPVFGPFFVLPFDTTVIGD
jgi:hypothetical protein